MPKQKEYKEVNGVILVDNLNDTEDEEMQYDDGKTPEISTTKNNDDNVVIVSQSAPSAITFKSLSRTSREEVRPLLRVNRFQNIPFKNIVIEMRGPAKGIQEIGDDGNCYFRAVLFCLVGNECLCPMLRPSTSEAAAEHQPP